MNICFAHFWSWTAPQTARLRIEVYLDFLDSIKRAIQAARQVNLAVICKAAQDGSWQAAAWFLERTDFEEFGNKSKFEHTGKDGKPVTIIVEYEDGPKNKGS